MNETLDHLGDNFPEGIPTLFHHVLTTIYFKWHNKFYEQLDGVAIGNPVSPVFANYYMQTFEKTTFSSAPREHP